MDSFIKKKKTRRQNDRSTCLAFSEGGAAVRSASYSIISQEEEEVEAAQDHAETVTDLADKLSWPTQLWM